MKINFPALFQTPLNKYRFFFIFGNNTEVFERAIFFIETSLKALRVPKEEKELLKGDVFQPSLFEDCTQPKVTLVSPVSDKILAHLPSLREGIYIFTSEKARAASKLVTTFSSEREAIAIACYDSPLSTSEFEFLVGEMNLAVSFKGLLFKAFQNDYKGLLTTLAKVKLFGDITEDDYDLFLETSRSYEDINPLLQALLLKDGKKMTETFSCLSASDQIPFIRGALRAFQTLSELIPYQKSSGSIPWQTFTPPVFFKDQPLYQTALSRWRGPEIIDMVETLLTLERQVKFSGYSESPLKEKLLSSLG